MNIITFQQVINQQEKSKVRAFITIGHFIWLSWLYFDFYFVDSSMHTYSMIIRVGLIFLYLPLYYLNEKFVENWQHIILSLNLLTAFVTILPLSFYSSDFTLYVSCCFIIPLMSAYLLVAKWYWYALQPLFFVITMLFYINELSTLSDKYLVFLFFYAMSIFFFATLTNYYAYKNQLKKIELDEQLQSSLEEKSSLVRILTHDLNNIFLVLNVGILSLKKFLFRNKDLPDKQISIIQRVDNSLNSFRELVEKVKEIESIQGEKKDFNLQEVDLEKVTNEAIQLFQDKAEEKAIGIQFHCKGSHYVLADPTVLKFNVLANIISNAIKFSPGNTNISILLNSFNNEVILTIEDKGQGVKKTDMSKIFDPTTKTSTKGTQGEKGTGFGLPLVKYSLDKMKIQWSFESRHIEDFPDDHGSSFTIIFSKHGN